MIKRVAQVVLIAVATTLLLDLAMRDMFKDITEETPAAQTVSTSLERPDVPIEVVEIVEPTILPSVSKHPVYYGLCLTDELIEYTEAACMQMGVDPVLAMALMYSETHGKWLDGDWDEELNRYRSIGFFQIRDVNWHWLKEKGYDVKTEEGNIDGGVYMLAELTEKYDGDMVSIITAYKCGETGGAEFLEQNIILDCVQEVIDTYNHYWED